MTNAKPPTHTNTRYIFMARPYIRRKIFMELFSSFKIIYHSKYLFLAALLVEIRTKDFISSALCNTIMEKSPLAISCLSTRRQESHHIYYNVIIGLRSMVPECLFLCQDHYDVILDIKKIFPYFTALKDLCRKLKTVLIFYVKS